MVEIEDLMIYGDEDGYYVDTEDKVKKWIMQNSYSRNFRNSVRYMSVKSFINNMVEPDGHMLSFMFGEFEFNEAMDILTNAMTTEEEWDAIAAEVARKYPEEYNGWVDENE